MFLKSLSMKGFKSFADPTVLEFEPGITVVVGPNGSGKSNVVDAVTWVLGAQGPRSLRSQKMEDVIFAGTSSRPALGRAEVSLTIDNSSARLPVDMAEVTITRTLFRSGDSEYAINGSSCRLLDIQDLLSDSGVGRQQHMIIGQGQLDTVLNARPEDRRAIIEEAAGVLKHRRRRERAERRLAATQENLERLGDLVREVRRQIRPLERQAAAARSYTTLADELREVRRHLAGVELAELAARRQAAAGALEKLALEEGELHQSLADLDAAAAETAAELSSRREEDLATSLGQVQGLVERCRGTGAVLRERARALAAALDAAADVDVVSTLEAEGARLAAELGAAQADAAALEPESHEVAAALEALADEEQAHVQRWGDGSEQQLAEEALSAARARLDLGRQSVEQHQRALRTLSERGEVLARRAEALEAAAGELADRAAAIEEDGEALRRTAVEAEATVADLAEAAEEAQREADKAEQARHRSAARAEALGRALQELQGTGGRELLAGVDGVVGSLVDLVEIDEGWEAAFEAAAGAAVAAVVVEGRAAAHEALARLRSQRVTGAVLAAGTRTAQATHDDGGPLPDGAEPLRPHIRARGSAAGAQEDNGAAGIGGVLDALVGRAVRVERWEEAIDLSLDRPDLVVVTVEGDRFAESGWRVRSGQGVVTAAAVEEAERRAVEIALAADAATEGRRAARAALEAQRHVAVEARRAADRHEAAVSAITRDRVRNEEERLAMADESADARAAEAEARQQLETAAGGAQEVETAIPELEAAAARAAERAEQAAQARGELVERRRRIGAGAQALEIRSAGLAERQRVLTERQAEVERRLEGHAEERSQAAERRRRLEAEGAALSRLERVVEAERESLDGVLDTLQRDYRSQVEAVRAGGERLETLRRDRSSTERRLDDARERARALDLEAAEVALRADALVEGLRRDLGAEPEDVVDAPCPELPEGRSPADHARVLADKLAGIGPVNPLALEELSVLEERQHELETQVDDVRSARRELHQVVRTLDDEIMQSFASAAADVNEHFSALVGGLFPGGVGRLALTEPDDLLHTGVEIEVRPAGRNVRRVSLLSGGERSLAALAFLFAVFRSRPSPFYLMDEVEAALDDVNLSRFLGLVHEFRAEAQLIVVSHQKRTMETGDALYGVTMAPGGSSQVVSQKMARKAVVPDGVHPLESPVDNEVADSESQPEVAGTDDAEALSDPADDDRGAAGSDEVADPDGFDDADGLVRGQGFDDGELDAAG